MKNSIMYFLFEGFSRGGLQLFLLFISYYFGESTYVTIMLLISLETFLPLFYPTNYFDALLPLFKKYDNTQIYSNFFTLNILFLTLFGILFSLILESLKKYFHYSDSLVYVSILLNTFFVRWLYFSAFMKQMEERHTLAIQIKGLPFLLSLLFSALFVFVFKDKVLGFFLGKTIGIFIFFTYFMIFDGKKFFSWNLNFILDFFHRSKFLVLTGLLGWATGYGFLNIAHIYYTDTETKNFAYMLNIYMIFLMVIFGMIQVVRPKILKLIESSSKSKMLTYFLKIMMIYIIVALFGYIMLMVLKKMNMPVSSVKNIVHNGAYSILFFLMVAAESTARIFIYAKDKIKNFTFQITIIELSTWAIVIFLILTYKINIFLVFFSTIFMRTVVTLNYFKREII